MKPAVRKPYAVGIKRREEILEAALEIFSVQGYRGAALADIAARVGLTLAGVLHYFSSKEEILATVLQRRDEGLTPWFVDTWAETGSFSSAVHELMVHSMQSPHVLRLFVTMSAESTDPSHPSHEYFQQRYRSSREHFGEVLRQAKELGQVQPAVSGPVLMAVLDGLQLQWLLDPTFDLLGELDGYLQTIAVNPGPLS
ncbi:MAG TPA: TetR/AcrR family transcriptional regulator [Acidimicrobiales bacterium]|jgi:AcrR family transcriptional regulator|nr:TetR/AcrR family transcriptional regulator [Acidimicrobiales bacterium]